MSAALAFFAAAAAVLGAWEALAAVEGTAVASALGRVAEPLRRAASEGREPTAPERRRLKRVAPAALLAGGWLVGGPVAAVLSATAGPVLTVTVVRARGRRYVAELCRGAPESARALADALGAGHS